MQDLVKENICKSIDQLLEKIEKSGAYITIDAKLEAKKIQKSIRSLELNSNIYNDN